MIPIKLFSQDWIFIGIGKGKDTNMSSYIRSEYLSKNEYGIKIWIKTTYPKLTVKKVVYTNVTEKQLFYINCPRHQYYIISTFTYNKNGTVIDSFNDSDTEWNDVVPESIGEMNVLKVCELFNK